MSTLFKNKILTGLVILLLVANITTIVVFWTGMRRMPLPQQPSAYIISELSLNNDQQEQYKTMVKKHRQQSKLIQEQVRANKDSFFDLLAHENINDSIKNNIATKIASLDRQLDLLTFQHFNDVRKICNPVQQQKFDKIIKKVLRMMAGPAPHGDMPPGPPGDGPPQDGPPPGQ